MKKVVIVEDDGVLYVFESLYDLSEFAKKHDKPFRLSKIDFYEYEIVNSEGLMIKYKKL